MEAAAGGVSWHVPGLGEVTLVGAWGGPGFAIPTHGCPSHGGALENMSFAFTVLAQNEH